MNSFSIYTIALHLFSDLVDFRIRGLIALMVESLCRINPGAKAIIMHTNKQLDEFASRQFGYFSARQALLAGYTKDLQSYHAKCGNWQKIDRALYRLPGFADTIVGQFIRCTLWAEGQSKNRTVAVSHASALHYYGLTEECPAQVHLSVSSLKKGAPCPGCILHWEAPEEYEIREGFNLVTARRTLRTLRPDLILTFALGTPAAYQQTEAG